MAFIDGEAETAIALAASTAGTLYMSSAVDAAIVLFADADLVKATRLSRARATSPTRVRVDFSAPVDSNDALLDRRNWRLWSAKDGEFQPPTVLGVEVPASAGSHTSYVILLTSEMNDGAIYSVTINSSSLSYGTNMFTSGDMEDYTETLARWGLVSGSATDLNVFTLPGDTSSSLEVNMAIAGTPAGVYQSVTPYGRAYLIEGRALSGSSSPLMKVQWRPGLGPVVELWSATTTGALGWVDIDGGGGNRQLVYTPSRPGHFEFVIEDPSAATGYWDDLSARPVLGVGAPEALPVTSMGEMIARDAVSFVGLGSHPRIKMALSTTANDVFIYFTENLQTGDGTISVDASSFTGSLLVSSVVEVGVDYIHLRTAPQAPGEVYQITIDNAIVRDLAGNMFATPASIAVLGYAEGDALARKQPLDMYRFLIEVIRNEDQRRGAQFLQRFLKGPQDVWELMTSQALSLPKLWSVEEAPDGVLKYMKHMVGWTQKLEPITRDMDADMLRRLISVSAPFWKERGSDDLVEDILRMLTGVRVRVLDWFWYRTVLDETVLAEDLSGFDPWLPDDPSEGHDHLTYVVRIVDDGTLDRALVRSVLRLMRPTGERIEVAYLAFYDAFSVAGDTTQWAVPFGTSSVGGLLLLADGAGLEEAVVTVGGGDDWASYTLTVRALGSAAYYIDAYRLDVGGQQEAYRIEVDIDNNSVFLVRIHGGVGTVLAYIEFTLDSGSQPLYDDEFDTFRLVITPVTTGTPTNDIKVYRNGILIIEADDDALTRGTVAIGHPSGGYVHISEVEAFLNPMNCDFIDINS